MNNRDVMIPVSVSRPFWGYWLPLGESRNKTPLRMDTLNSNPNPLSLSRNPRNRETSSKQKILHEALHPVKPYPSIRPSMRSSIHLSVCLSTYLPTCLPTYLS